MLLFVPLLPRRAKGEREDERKDDRPTIASKRASC
jgi:hypothetical protein